VPSAAPARKRVARLAFLVADHRGISSGIGGLFNSHRWDGSASPPPQVAVAAALAALDAF